jgi:hypothetical protein
MGLRELDPATWFEAGVDVETQLGERNQLIAEKREVVFGALPGYEKEIASFTEKIVANLREHHSEYEIEGSIVHHLPTGIQVDLTVDHAFLQLAKVVCEDLCLMQKVDGVWTLVTGVVVFPSRWDLREKLGKGIDQIHTPVPGYQQALQPYMSTTFEKIMADRPVWRRNWSLHSTADLHQPTSIHQPAAPDHYWWRTERQTLTRLGDSDSLLFTIRNRAEPLSWIKNDPEAAQAFAETIATMSPETLEYKSLVNDRDAIIEYLKN